MPDGILNTRNGNLFWNDVDLCNGMSYPIKAPNGTVLQPSYSFANDNTLGMTSEEGSIVIVKNGSKLARFEQDEFITTNVKTNSVILGDGYLDNEDGNLVWHFNGEEIHLGLIPEPFNGGIVEKEILVPSLKIQNYALKLDGNDALDISQNSQSVAKISASGISVNAIKLKEHTISEEINELVVKSKNGVVMRVSENQVSYPGEIIAIGDGIIQKSGNSLLWQTEDVLVDLSKKSLDFPLKAPKEDGVMYGFEDSEMGVAKDGDALVLKSENGVAILEDDGYITTTGINTNSIISAEGIDISIGNGNYKFTSSKLETAGVFRSKNNVVGFGYDTKEGSIGLGRSGDAVSVVSGPGEAVVISDDAIKLDKRKIMFGESALEKRGNDIYFNGSLLNKKQETWYRSDLEFTAATGIKKGDLICMDPNGSGRVYKGIGGRVNRINTIDYSGNCKSLSVFDYDNGNYILAYAKTKSLSGKTAIMADINLVSKSTHSLQKSHNIILMNDEYKDNSLEGYGKILQINSNDYLLVSLKPGESYVKITKTTNTFNNPVREDVIADLGITCDCMTAEYDINTNMLVIACHSLTTQNFVIALVNVETMEIGTIETSLASIAIADANKQIHLSLIPGGTYIVSYGIVKMVFITSSYSGSITPGDTFLDYESVDCAGMFYDNEHGVVMTLEKTVSGSCYIQILDVLGVAIQKMTSKGFKNANVEPLGVSYNQLAGSYAILYSTGLSDSPVYIQNFDFDGELITFGLRYQDVDMYEPNNPIKHGGCLFEIPGTKYFVYGYDEKTLSVFETGYHGIPSGYLGIALTDAKTQEACKITVKGHIFYSEISLPVSWMGKKLYMYDSSKDYPEYLTTTPLHGVFIGTCLDTNRILLGL